MTEVVVQTYESLLTFVLCQSGVLSCYDPTVSVGEHTHLGVKHQFGVAKLIRSLMQQPSLYSIRSCGLAEELGGLIVARSRNARSMSSIDPQDVGQSRSVASSLQVHMEIHFHVVALDTHDVQAIAQSGFSSLKLIHVVRHFVHIETVEPSRGNVLRNVFFFFSFFLKPLIIIIVSGS